ncbi:phosphonate metabolism transcriptional regulator PhnF [Ramlibacter sp. H39-3-26]|uniref:phosphonate metabolism transcriptional regulator PhnF n=1 Tax=Curvibacter soli TaxID=3031331 RepID=UPI0023DC188B|nr:phosphonate metabolism transcriptional regulator PhnF [Ramlibacter sp. H39-3-26]MDF1484634.1 phosphonate metabolism transcriptional regulator PhnF [Ramlibacter sp. H39-3-26]
MKRRWGRIAEELASGIGRGKQYQPGQRLPTESELARQFGVNRHTIRQALDSLRGQGLVRTTQGSGTYVEEFAVSLALARRSRLHRSLALAGLHGQFGVLEAAAKPASAAQARALAVPARSPLSNLTLIVVADGVPLHVSQRVFPLPRFAGLEAVVRTTGSISAGLAACGVADYVRKTSSLRAEMPQAWVAAALQQRLERPVLCTESVNVDMDGVPIEYSTTWFAGDRVTITVNHDDT